MKRLKADRRDGWYEITPSDAHELIEARHKNRPLREVRAARIASDITAGRYGENGETLIFCDRGRLLDGQTRLRAVVLANKPIVTYCVFGVSAAQFDTMDQGASRSTQDLVAVLGYKKYATVSAAAKLCLRYETSWLADNVPVRNWAVDDWLRKNGRELSDALSAMDEASGGKFPVGCPPATVLFLYYYVKSHPKAGEFARGLATGAELRDGSPILTLRTRLAQPGLRPWYRVAFVIKAWNAFAAGRNLGVIKWLARPGGAEPLPRIAETEESAE